MIGPEKFSSGPFCCNEELTVETMTFCIFSVGPVSSNEASVRATSSVNLRVCLTFLWLVTLMTSAAAQTAPSEAATNFTRRCTGCHTYGKGVKVGPDLKGVTDRRKRPWLMSFIRSSQTVIKSGDPTATNLFRQFNRQQMPDHELSAQQIEELLDYLAAGGPEQQSIDERPASMATRAEIEEGRRLFHGEKRFAHGGQACSGCHSVNTGGLRGGNLGPDLSTSYLSFRDMVLTSFLKRACFPRAPEISKVEFLTPQESFNLKAYLREVSLPKSEGRARGVAGSAPAQTKNNSTQLEKQ